MNAYPAGLSLCMIVRDEERFLADALRSVAGVVDELCIVDTGSTDGTLAIARAFGARVIEVPWQDDFALARNAALAMATRRWILVLDADERLAAQSRAALAAIGAAPAAGRGRWLQCRNLTDDFKGSGALTNALVRIFPNDSRIRYRNAIHEFIAADGFDGGLPADTTDIEIVHHGYLSAIVEERRKPARNLRLSRLAAQRDPADAFHHYNLGMASLLAGDRQAALAALERMYELTRAQPRGYRIHGLTVLAELVASVRGDVDAAIALVNECLALVPTYANAHFVHGRLLVLRGDRFAARNAFGRAIAAGQHDRAQFVVDGEIAVWKAHAEIAATLMHERRFADALAWLELATQARPTAQPLVLERAKCYEALGDLAAARRLFGAAFAAYADEASAVEWINFLFRHGPVRAAYAAIESALPVIDPDTRVLMLATAAAVRLRAGERDAARAALARALTQIDADAARRTVESLAAHLAMPELAALLEAAQRVRAQPLRIAYVS